MPQAIEACRVCGKAWTKWSSSKLQCHAKCYPPELMEDVLRLKEQFPHATLRRIATDLGFSVGTIRCWLFMAWKRRKDQPSKSSDCPVSAGSVPNR